MLLLLLACTGCGSCAKQRTESTTTEDPQSQQEGVRPANTRVRSHPPQIGHHPRGQMHEDGGATSTPAGDP